MKATGMLTEAQVARICGLSVSTLRRYRVRGEGPRYLRLGRSVRYMPGDVRAWLAKRQLR